ncbi:MAG: hypothetical protein ACLU9S_01290 [Oscillospiraceae bacterium]
MTWPYLLAGLLCLVLAYVLSRLPALPPPVAELQAQNSVLILLALLVLGFLQRQCLYQSRLALTVGIALLMLLPPRPFWLGLLPASRPEKMLSRLPYSCETLLPAAQRYLSPGAE